MKTRFVLSIGLSLLMSAGFAAAKSKPAKAAAAPPAPACDRECMHGVITAYLNALVKHDAKKLPLDEKARITEDSVEKPIDKVSLFRFVTKIRGYRQDFIDEREGIAGSDVIVEESGAPVLLVLRIKLANDKITELETVATHSRTEGAIFNIEALDRASEEMSYAPRKEQLNTREEMIKAALHYPAGLEAGSFVKVDAPFTDDAYRFENGNVMAGPNCKLNEGCKNIKTQPLGNGMRGKVETRVAAVDERMGIVWLRMAWGGDRPARDGQGPRQLAVWESFKIYDGKIHAVEAFMKMIPVGLGSGWPELNLQR